MRHRAFGAQEFAATMDIPNNPVNIIGKDLAKYSCSIAL
jgi:hypothetical protein